MKPNPLLNAVGAGAYIVLVATLMNTLSHVQPKDNFVTPILVLSMFTLSAAIMGYLFLSQPIQLYLDGKKKEAVRFFGQTVGVFAVITVIALGAMLLIQ